MTEEYRSNKELEVIRLMCANGVDGKVGNHYIRNGKIWCQKDDLHSIDDGCGCCWRRVTLEDLMEEKSDGESS